MYKTLQQGLLLAGLMLAQGAQAVGFPWDKPVEPTVYNQSYLYFGWYRHKTFHDAPGVEREKWFDLELATSFGYAINPYVRVELSGSELFSNVGEASREGQRWRDYISQDAQTVSLLLDYPMSRGASTYVRLGASRVTVLDEAYPLVRRESIFSGSYYAMVDSERVVYQSGSKTIPVVGVGLRSPLLGRVQLVADATYYPETYGVASTQLLIGFHWHFWRI